VRRLLLAAGIALVAVAALVVVGLPQLTAQAPVPGLRTTLIRTAGLDLLVNRNVPLGVVPQCVTAGPTIVCDGTRADGAPVRVEGPVEGDAVVTVTVAGRVLATAPAQQVVDAAGSAP
jgi:hypothetical protein